MYANVASGTLIVLGAVIAVLGFILAASFEMVALGLGSVAVGGMISAVAQRAQR